VSEGCNDAADFRRDDRREGVLLLTSAP